MKAGFYESDITPSLGMEQPGGYGKSYVKSYRDNLKVRAAVFSSGKESVALVGIDSCIIQSAEPVKIIRQEVEKRTGIKAGAILMGASHTHAGGPFFGLREDEYADVPEPIKTLISKHSTVTDSLYYEYLIGQTVTAICEAYTRRQEAVLSCGSGYEDKVAFNRRVKMKQGRAYTHPGKGNPDIIDFAGPIDPEVGVIAAWDMKGNLLGTVVNYACHGTTNYGAVTADWIYFLEKRIQGAMGKDSIVVFLNGASGDVTQVNNLSMSEREFGEKYADFVGTRVAAEVIKVMVTAEKGDCSPVSFAQKFLELKRRKPSKERLAKSLKIVEDGLKNNRFDTEWTFAKELLIADYFVKKEPIKEVEVQGIQVGPVVFLANPAEFFCNLGLKIKKSSLFPLTFVVELANGGVGYVPDKKAFSSTGGGYETILTSYSNLEEGAGDKIVEASIQIAEKFKPGQLPSTPQVDKKGTPWDYGILGPDKE
ncbi:hypothetical protein M0P98_01345 [bacterium]|nr:hypothetical protein [bacterium]